MTAMHVQIVKPDDDLQALAAQINDAEWDDANEMADYDAQSLQYYLLQQDTVFIACHDADGVLLGISSGRFLIKPYEKERWLYVDEVDVAVNHRKKGAGKAMMNKLFDMADDHDCEEVWLGTETDNEPAKALYRSLDPEEEETFVGFTWEPD